MSLTESEEKLIKNYIKSLIKENYYKIPKFNIRKDLENKPNINKTWKNYKSIKHHANEINPLTTLKEGLIKTYPIDKTIDYIKDYLGLEEWQIQKINAFNNQEHIIITIPTIGNNLDIVCKLMDYCGWYLSFPKKDDVKQAEYVDLQFEAKIQNKVTKQIRKSENILYHLTPDYYIDKIKKIGFSPKSKNSLFDYPDRIYFIKGSTNNNEIRNIGEQLANNNKSEYNASIYYLITIDLDKIPENVDFYYDGNYPHGVYTTSNIRPDCIINIEKIYF